MNKKKVIRLVLFVLMLGVAVYSFTNGIMSLTKRESGYYDVDFTAEGNAVLYRSGLHFVCRAEGTSNAIRRRLNEMQKLYTALTLDAFKLYDARQTYEGYVNIASINALPNTAVEISEPLFTTLETIYGLDRNAYSMFAGGLHGQWETLRYLEDPDSFDPLNNTDRRELLSQFARWLSMPGTFDMEFDRDSLSVKLIVSREYLSWAQENEISYPVLDLNVLHDACLIERVAGDLLSKGCSDGYLYTDSGLYVYLPGEEKTTAFTLTGYDGTSEIAVATLLADVPVTFCRFTAFAPEGMLYGYYVTEQEGKRFYRHLYPDILSGEYQNQLMTLFLLDAEHSALALACILADLNSLQSPFGIERYVEALPESTFAVWTLQNDGEKRLYVRDGGAKKALATVPDGGFEAVFVESRASVVP